jgi:microcompartment protein CcmK/EutM
MDMARAIGTVVCTQKDPALVGNNLLVLQPIDEHKNDMGQPIIAVDPENNVGTGEICYFVAGGDAAQVTPGIIMPSDTTIVGIVDWINTSI